MNITLDGFLSSCILILIILLYIFIKKYREYARHNKLYKLVSWCVTEDSGLYRYNLHLENYLIKAQSKLNLSQEFQITEEELEYTRVILKHFQQDVSKNYFNNISAFHIPKCKHEIDGEIYFFYLLHSFLYNCDRDVFKHEIYKNIISKDIHAGGSNITYELSDFGITLYKLLYITYMFCNNALKLNSNKPYYSYKTTENSFKEAVITKTITITR